MLPLQLVNVVDNEQLGERVNLRTLEQLVTTILPEILFCPRFKILPLLNPSYSIHLFPNPLSTFHQDGTDMHTQIACNIETHLFVIRNDDLELKVTWNDAVAARFLDISDYVVFLQVYI
jgi:hypothetical protein